LELSEERSADNRERNNKKNSQAGAPMTRGDKSHPDIQHVEKSET
jgi:hypothetical protein